METGGREEKMSKMVVRLLQQARNTAGSLLTRLDAGQVLQLELISSGKQ